MTNIGKSAAAAMLLVSSVSFGQISSDKTAGSDYDVLEVRLMVDGEGYLRLAKGGKIVYARSATLRPVQNIMTTSDGAVLWPRMVLPKGAQEFEVNLEGHVFATTPKGRLRVGQVVLAQFPKGMEPKKKVGAYLTGIQKPSLVNPGDDLAGVVRVEQEFVAKATKPQKHTHVSPETTEPATATSSQKIVTETNRQAPKPTVSESGKPVQIRLKQRTEVTTENFTLGDIATLSGDEVMCEEMAKIDLGKTPPIGVRKIFNEPILKATLLAAGIEADRFSLDVPTAASLVRKSAVLKGSDVDAKAIESAKTKSGLDMPFRVLQPMEDMPIPDGEIEIETLKVFEVGDGYSVELSILLNGKKFAQKVLRVAPDSSAPSIKAGTTVRIRMICRGAAVEAEGKLVTKIAYVGQMVTVSRETTPEPGKQRGETVMHTGKLINPNTVEVIL